MEKHVPSLLPPGKKWKLVWHDEFDGDTLDLTKWDFRLHLMQQRHDTFTDEGARLDGKGNLELFLIEKEGQFFSSQLQTGSNYLDRPGDTCCFEKGKIVWPIAKIREPKFMHKFGYYEVRCKLQKQPGWWSAFWLQSPCIGSTLNPEESGVEVDIMENFTRDNVVSSCNHWNGYGLDHKNSEPCILTLKNTPDDYHVFGLEWRKDAYIYYVDGKETNRITGPVSQREQFILLSTECIGYRAGNEPSEELRKAVLPDAFVVDYVRVFDEVETE